MHDHDIPARSADKAIELEAKLETEASDGRISEEGALNRRSQTDRFVEIDLQLTAGETYRVSVNALDGAPYPRIYLFDTDGAFVVGSDIGGVQGSSAIPLRAPETGTYSVLIDLWADQRGTPDPGRFTLALDRLEIPTYSLDQIGKHLAEDYWTNEDLSFGPWPLGADRTLTYDVSSLSGQGRQQVEWAFDAWSAITGITFRPTTGTAQIDFFDTDEGGYASSSFERGQRVFSQINVERELAVDYPGIDNYGYYVALHEIGHALGLGHGGFYNGTASYGFDAVYLNDTWATTVMSYFPAYLQAFEDLPFALPLTPMPGDIAAIERLYGPVSVNEGNTVYGRNSNFESPLADYLNAVSGQGPAGTLSGAFDILFTIVDTGGIDLIDARDFADGAVFDLRDGATSSGATGPNQMFLMPGTVIENVIGTDRIDEIIGNAAANRLDGWAGNDIISGGAGNDVIFGNWGYDVLRGDDGRDVIDGGVGDDKIYGGRASDTGMGGSGNDQLYGEFGRDTLSGGAGADLLKGGGGKDVLDGGWANDRLIGGTAADQLWGGGGNDVLLGQRGPDQLHGGSGEDRLDGGFGDDFLTGGFDADTFVFRPDGGMDVIRDFTFGEDVLLLSSSFLGAGQTLESLLDDVASVNGDAVQLAFSADDILTVRGLNSIEQLAQSITFDGVLI